MTDVIRFHFDYISPYAYLAWTQIHALAQRCACTVEPVPILFAALLNHHGQKGPAEIPSKRLYVGKNVVRIAASLGVPLTIPASHPFNPLLALRVSSLPMEEDVRRRLIDRLFAATWGGGTGVTDADTVAQIAEEAGVSNALERGLKPENKARLKEATATAVEAGVFGVPTASVRGELFWGVDSLPHLEQFIKGNDPVTEELLTQWSNIQATASRL